jgi:hypothetical protein
MGTTSILFVFDVPHYFEDGSVFVSGQDYIHDMTPSHPLNESGEETLFVLTARLRTALMCHLSHVVMLA